MNGSACAAPRAARRRRIVVLDADAALVERLRERLAEMHPGTPVIALSPTFLPGVASEGAVARRLGAAAGAPR